MAQVASDEPRFPSLDSSYLKTGDFIGPDHVKRLMPGLSKDQVRLELGNPHFNEGIFAVRDWDYAFNFYNGKGDEFTTCQFKVRFNKDNRVVATYWKTPECEAFINPVVTTAVASSVPIPTAEVAVVAVVPEVLPVPHQITLGADALFAFGRSDVNDLNVAGRNRLRSLAIELKNARLSSVVVTGHTDRLGSTSLNQALSEARAATVRAYLIEQGLDGQLVRTYGAGEREPVVQCEGKRVTPELVNCLKPNRRGEVEVTVEQ